LALAPRTRRSFLIAPGRADRSALQSYFAHHLFAFSGTRPHACATHQTSSRGLLLKILGELVLHAPHRAPSHGSMGCRMGKKKNGHHVEPKLLHEFTIPDAAASVFHGRAAMNESFVRIRNPGTHSSTSPAAVLDLARVTAAARSSSAAPSLICCKTHTTEVISPPPAGRLNRF